MTETGDDANGRDEQHNLARDGGRVHAVQNGTQYNIDQLTIDMHSPHHPVPAVRSLAPPFGRRDAARPVRGREAVLDELCGLFEHQRGPRVQVLHGLGGCGKTTVALELAHLVVQGGAPVWWVDASTGPGLAAGMYAVARRLGVLIDDLRYGPDMDVLWERLRAYRERWLLVIDGADRPELLADGAQLADGTGWLRPLPDGPGLILVTSKDSEGWAGWCQRRQIGTLEVDDAAAVLHDLAATAGGQAQARLLSARLGGHPLALRAVGAYLAETAQVPWSDPEIITTFAGYLAALETADDANGSAATVSAQLDVMSQAVQLSLELLAARGMASARGVLWLLAGLADGPVPYRLVLDPRRGAELPALGRITSMQMWRLLQALAGLSLLELENTVVGVPVVTMHPLVRQVSRHWEQPFPPHERAVALATLLCDAAGELPDPEVPDGWPAWQVFTPHLLHVVREVAGGADPGRSIARLVGVATEAIRHLRARGMFEVAEAEYLTLLDICRQMLGDVAPQTLSVRLELANVCHYRGMKDVADREFRSVLAARQELLGEEHPDTLRTRRGLARVLRAEGRFGQAFEELLGIYAIEQRLLGEDHTDTLITRHQLARVRHNLGELDLAEAEFRAVLAARQRLLGEEHPDTLLTWHQLAHVLHSKGRLTDAAAEYRQVLELRRAAVGQDHPDTLHSRCGLARVMLAEGMATAAETEFQQVFLARTAMLGESHPDTLSVRENRAQAMLARGEIGAAQAELTVVRSVRAEVLGPAHPETMRTKELLDAIAFPRE